MRVISGAARGIPLKTLGGSETRPTTDRVKEAMFSMIHQRLPGAAVLDVFCGSGALAIEALSRGAQSAVLIEANAALKPVLMDNLTRTRCIERARLIFGEARMSLSQLSGDAFDVIFMDPPYLKGWITPVLSSVDRYGLLNAGGIIVVEHKADDAEVLLDEICGFQSIKRKKYGKIGVTLYGREL